MNIIVINTVIDAKLLLNSGCNKCSSINVMNKNIPNTINEAKYKKIVPKNFESFYEQKKINKYQNECKIIH